MELYPSLRSVASALRSATARTRDTNLSFMAASVSFYAFFSVVPIVILALSVGSSVFGEGFGRALLAAITGYLSPEGAALVSEALTSRSGKLGASVAGATALSWSALKVFRAVGVAFESIYEADRPTSIRRGLRDAVVALASIAAGVAMMVALGLGVSHLIGGMPYAGTVSSYLLFVGLAAVFLPLYFVMPPKDIAVRDVLPGTVTAVVGWHLLQSLFEVYASVAGRYRAYGLLGAVLLFLLWLYLGAYVLLFGAVVNAVLEER